MKTPSIFFLTALLLAGKWSAAQQGQVIYSSKAYTVYADRVVQGKYTARALSPLELVSNYRSPANAFVSPAINFKFSINGKDNEMVSGKDHLYYYDVGRNMAETPLLKFGTQFTGPKPANSGGYLRPASHLKIRLDMRDVLEAFKKQGYYTGAGGEKIYKNDFRGVYIAGSTAPMIWDFNNLVNHPELELKDPDGDGIYETILSLNEPKDAKTTASAWKPTRNLSALPQYRSNYVLSNALYNLTLEEMQNAIEPDSTFRTGKEWSGVWTRDISYSIILSMAALQPKVAMYSLMRKVKDGRVIQDTGTGGAYPVSSDRMIWAVAAWEVYKVTGDENWLRKAYAIIRKSADEDVLNVYDKTTGLVRGESSFLDWREETYPKWMQPADIYQSECLGTNAVHFEVNQVLAQMATRLGEPAVAREYAERASRIKQGIEKYLWQPQKGYYGQYLYGRNFLQLSPRAEALGEALTVLFDIAGPANQQTVVSHTPLTPYGISCIYPQIPGILPYHNDAVWPFVESYWALAGAKAGNEAAVLKSISAIYRPAAMFLTNKENFVASNGDFAGTQINSSNMLWSLSGNLALVYKVLFGMHYEADALTFKPFVPKVLGGPRALQGYPYRGAVLDIQMNGYGNRIKKVTLDGKVLTVAKIPATLHGYHTLVIQMDNNNLSSSVNLVPDSFSRDVPEVTYVKGQLSWRPVQGAASYGVMQNGRVVSTIKSTTFTVDSATPAEYQVCSIDEKGMSSFASEPLEVLPSQAVQVVEAENSGTKAGLSYQGYSGEGFVRLSIQDNQVLSIPVTAPQDGFYSIDFRYANGNGPINTENKCAIRTLKVDGKFAGTIVLPQRGKGEWSNWGMSNPVKLQLSKGQHQITLALEEANTNMNGETNEAMIDYLRLRSW